MTLAVLCAVLASVGYAVGTVMQSVGARQASGVAVVVRPLVLGAFVVDLLAWLLSLVALDVLPLFVVQSVVASSLVVVVLLAAVVLDVPVRRVDLAWIVVVTLSLVLLAVGSGHQPASPPPASFTAVMYAAAGLFLVAVLAAYRSGPAPLLAALGGLGYAGTAIAARGAQASGDLGEAVRDPLAWTIVLFGVVGTLGILRALERDSAGRVVAVSSVVEVVVPSVVGLSVLGDTVRPGWALVVAVAMVVAVVGCVALSFGPAAAATGGEPVPDPAAGA